MTADTQGLHQRAGGLAQAEAERRLEHDGPNEVAPAPRHPLRKFLGKFWGLSAWMLELIAALSFVLHKRADFAIALGLLVVNAVLSTFQEQRASSAVAALRRRVQVNARVLRDGAWRAIPARELVVGDAIRLRAGDFVPADARAVEGELRIDQSALTGESRELVKRAGELLYSGSIVRRGEATAVVEGTGARTYFGRTTHLVESAEPKLHVEEITARLVKWLFVIVGVLVGIAFALSIARGFPILDVLPLSLVLLLSAVPVALPVMFTVSTAVGSMELGRQGVLVTHLAAVEDAANMDVLCADKTGTLTQNRLVLRGVLPEPSFSDDDVVATAALASNDANEDPIDVGFLEAARSRHLLGEPIRALEFVPFSPETRRTEALVERGGVRIRAQKGALRTIAELAGVDATRLERLEARATAEAAKGSRVLAVARSVAGEPLRFVGLAFLDDPPRPDSRRLVSELRALGVEVKMLTGDALPVAREIAKTLGLGPMVSAQALHDRERVPDAAGFAEVFPDDKFDVVKDLQTAGHVVGMTGDGVNDAPALRQAEVGIAVRGATDVAKGAASLVLTKEGLTSIVDLVKTGRAIYQRILTWIVNKVSRTILKAGFVVITFVFTGRFVISALGMVLLVFMTDFVKIALSTDRVRPSAAPETWHIGPLVRIAVALGVLMLAESLGVLAAGMRLFHLDGAAVHTFSFTTLLFFAIFSIVSIRERRAFWRSKPSAVLAAALGADAIVGLAIAALGLADLAPLPPGPIAFAVGAALVCSLGPNDYLKLLLFERRPNPSVTVLAPTWVKP